jgi:hypothetical protein
VELKQQHILPFQGIWDVVRQVDNLKWFKFMVKSDHYGLKAGTFKKTAAESSR